ncbi:MAG TPA: L,D-transpeptidase family protein [Acidimicrobiia bacterium]|nr:L,D-transpeptidase family protein [Acidimicrobiia bacterium]
MWRRLAVTMIGLALIAAVIAIVGWGAADTHVEPSVDGHATPLTPAPTTVAPVTIPPASSSTTTTTTTPPPRVLREGASGPDVAALQRRLRDLGYWLDDANGVYDTTTAHAVVAFQKSGALERDGVVGPLTRAALERASRVTPRSSLGHVIEIDKRRQLLLDVFDGRVRWVFDTSTGATGWTTPTGYWHIFRQVDGWDPSPLGMLYRSKYFRGGIAIHGYPSVPPYPASHGCVRVINPAIDWMWANNELPIGTAVWVYES